MRSTLLFIVLVALLSLSTACQSTLPPLPASAAAFDDSCEAELGAAKGSLAGLLGSGPHSAQDALEQYNQLSRHIDNAYGTSGLAANVHPSEEVRKAAESCEQEVSTFITELSLNRDLFEVFSSLDDSKLDAEAKRLSVRILRDFRRAGVDKDEATRKRIKKLNEEIVLIGQNFGRNIREDVRFIELDDVKSLDGLPQDYIDLHSPGKNGKIRITTDYPDVIPFLKYSEDGEARKKIRFEYLNRGYPKNIDVLDKLLTARHELAGLLGYSNWADYITEDKMIGSAAAAESFIEKISALAEARAQRDFEELLERKKKDFPEATVVSDWESSYFSSKLKKEKYSFDGQAVRPYFEYEKVRDGLLGLTGDLFGIRYVAIDGLETWDPSVSVYDVFDGDKRLGRIYLDMHPREKKYKHAAQFTLRSGVRGEQMPEGVLVCNFPDPSKGLALMDHRQVVTFFHEFGHLLHHTFGGADKKWIEFSGVATEWDFVEAPSQLFEEWAWSYEVLKKFATHHETGEVIPAEMVERMRAADEFGRGLSVRQQMFYASISLHFHNQDPSTFKTTEKLAELQSKYSVFPFNEGTHMQASFGHLDGYSAIYYTYMWSLVIAKDIISKFLAKDLLDPELALRYRDKILAPGGLKDAKDLVEDFLGRPYAFDAFRDWLSGKK